MGLTPGRAVLVGPGMRWISVSICARISVTTMTHIVNRDGDMRLGCLVTHVDIIDACGYVCI